MKHRLHLFIGIVLILTLVLNIFISGCAQEEETTPPPTTPPPTTTPAPTTTEPATLSAIAVTPASPANLDAGSTQQFTATGTYSDGSTSELFSVNWNSDNPNVATIDYNGLATGVGAGETNITATLSGITSPSVSLTVVGELITPAGITVYVSVSVDGELLVAAQPVTVTDMTVDGALKAAHAAYYSGGESGYTAGIDPTFGVYLITQCWGVEQIPFVILNDTPVPGPTVTTFVDATPVVANDNIIICTSSVQGEATPVSLTATLSGDSATLTATAWIFDPATFTYTSAPLANANVVDPTTGVSLGTTDADGNITVTIPESGIVAIEGLAAINLKPATTTPPEANVISYLDAKAHIGETVTIEDKVFEKIDNAPGSMWVLFLGAPSSDANTVGIEVLYSDLSKFPADLYVGKTIRITGELHANPVGGASFSLTDPSQVVVVE